VQLFGISFCSIFRTFIQIISVHSRIVSYHGRRITLVVSLVPDKSAVHSFHLGCLDVLLYKNVIT
jgi:hypothetical protein